MKRMVWTSVFTLLVTGIVLTVAFIYLVGGYFVDLGLRRGSAEDPFAPPAVFRSAFEGNGSALSPAARPDFSGEDWQLVSFDGLKLEATHFSPAKSSHQWVILVHGYGCNQQYGWDYAAEYLRHGYEVLTPDLRASGESEGHYLTMGALESHDLEDWTRKIVAADPEARIVLHGVSMGAATVMLTTARSLPPNVVAAVEDCGYTDTRTMFEIELQKLFGLPGFPVLDCADLMCRSKAGFRFADVEPLRAVRQTQVPMLFIHGDADKLVPYAMMQQLYQASAAPVKEVFTAKGAAHAAACQDKAYYPTVFAFADRFTQE